MDNLIRQIKLLKFFVAILTVLVVALFVFILTRPGGDGHFKEISVERMNIVEKDGLLRMVISNQERQHPGAIGGKEFPKRERSAGMIFFNSDGDECGGFTYDGNQRSADMSYSFDQYRNDQIMQLQYSQETAAKRTYGLKLWDRDDNYRLARIIELDDSLKKLNDTNAAKSAIAALRSAGAFGTERLFVGKNTEGEVGLFIRDKKGIPRLKIYVNKDNQPVIETLDEQGRPH